MKNRLFSRVSACFNHTPTESHKQNHTSEHGRSMVEMLGVLAIIGVLSIGAIAGYSTAMNKYKMNKTVNQISNIIANLRTVCSSSGNYAALSSEPIATAIKLGVFPDDMIVNSTTVKNIYGGYVYLRPVLPDDVAIFLSTAYWGDENSGLIRLTIGDT
jgi:Tfp pilus assembly protein FimT